MLCWDAAREATKDSEARARIMGVAAQMEKFEFFFALELGRKILNMIDNLSRSLQAKHMSACEGQKLVQVTLSALQSIRSDEQFSLFWQYVDVRRSRLDGAISSPVLTRHRKVPRLREIGESVSEQSMSTIQDYYRIIYFQVIDTAMGTIKDRFDQRGFLMLQKLETLLISRSAMDRSTLSEIISAYRSDFKSADTLETQLLLLRSAVNGDHLTNLQSTIF